MISTGLSLLGRKYIPIVSVCLSFLSVSQGYCDSGAMAFAYPIEGIVIDGKLSDWPAHVQTYSVQQIEQGDKLSSDGDADVRFRVGYHAAERSLYAAVEVADDSIVVDHSPSARWDSQDGCDIYVDGTHVADRSELVQYAQFGDRSHVFGSGSPQDLQVSVVRTSSKIVYEWRVRLRNELDVNQSLGFDVAVYDRDADGSFSWVAWSPGTQKLQAANRSGDVLLLAPGTRFGEVVGKTQWRELSHKPLPTKVRFQSRQFPKLWFATTVDSHGSYATTVPVGKYSVTAEDTREVRTDDSVRVDVDVAANTHVTADVLEVAPLPKPPLISEVGVLRRPEPIDASEIEQFLLQYMEYYDIPGLSIALIKDGKLAYHEGFGVKNSLTADPVQRSTVFNAASMTKVVFAYLVNRLAERGVLDLDTPLHQYLPFEQIAEAERSKRITARMVLNHSSGLPNWFSGKPEFLFEPGTKFGYSGVAFVYLGNVVSHLTGRQVEDLIQEEVFAPLKIRDASLIWNERFDQLAAFPHPDSSSPTYRWRPDEPNVASSLYISAGDYGKFLVALLSSQGLAEETLREMLRPQNDVPSEAWGLAPNHKASYGLGIVVEESPGRIWYSHGGNNPGFTSKFEIQLGERIGYVCLVNNQQAHNLNEDLQAFLINGKRVE